MTKRKPQISTPEDAADLIGPALKDAVQEELHLLTLNTRNYVQQKRMIYRGTIDSISIRIAEILRPAIVENTPSIIIAHNHPSGDLSPSPDDLRTTEETAQAAGLMGISLLDHIIVGDGRLYSIKRHHPNLFRQALPAATKEMKSNYNCDG